MRPDAARTCRRRTPAEAPVGRRSRPAPYTGLARLACLALALALLTLLAGCGSLPQRGEPPVSEARPAAPATSRAGQDRAGLDAGARSHGIPPDAARDLFAGRPPAARRPGHADARRAVLPHPRRPHRAPVPAAPARCVAARRARAAAGRRPLHVRRRRAVPLVRGVPQCRGAPVQPVLLPAREPRRQVRGIAPRFPAREPAHAQQALHRRRRDGRGGRAQHRRRVLHAQHVRQLRRHGRVHRRRGRAAARRHLRRVLEQSAGLPDREDRGERRRSRRLAPPASTRWSTKATR